MGSAVVVTAAWLITAYLITEWSSNGTTWTNIADGAGTAASYTATGLANGSRHYFQILSNCVASVPPA